ncbi:MAG: efflux RND transporter permease subunit [Phycisphaeraceae bacterium]|nr:efflux RND transporter permease subunit [Phycisphaeraceae bacterium]
MIAKLIHWCVNNRMMVMLLTGFLIAGGIWSTQHITVDAIPDLSDVQVIIRTEYPGQAPRIVEDQVTYPLTTAMLAVPQAKVVRGYSMFGSSFVYIIFEDGTDLYWARSRVLEQLSFVSSQLPKNVSPQLGPDATAVGWVYEYILKTGRYCPDHPQGLWHDPVTDTWYPSQNEAPQDDALLHRLKLERIFEDRSDCPLGHSKLVESQVDLAELRSLQDWYLRYELTSVDGVSEVAPIGGFVKQYQVVVDPARLLALNIPLKKIKAAIKNSNLDVGGRLIEMSETEYMVRGIGYLGSLTDEQSSDSKTRTQQVIDDLRQVALGANEDGKPIYLNDVAEIRTGSEIRRGVVDWNGKGETVGGVVLMRYAENAKLTIELVKEKLQTLEQGLPAGVALDVAYDRSDLIERAVETVYRTLTEEVIVVGLVIILFLLHARSALVAAFVLPTGVLSTLLVMYVMGVNANIMSLGGIAISIGVMVDSSIVMVENAHKHLEERDKKLALGQETCSRIEAISEAATEVGPTLFFSLLIITASFLPIFALGEQSGRMFKPLAFTKTFAMSSAALLAITTIPVMMVYMISDRVLPMKWSKKKRYVVYFLTILFPAIVLALIPMPTLGAYRLWLCLGWLVASGLILLPQKIYPEAKNPISLLLQKIYNPFFTFSMQYRWLMIVGAISLIAVTFYPLKQLGSEFMPPLEEGDLLYMPTTDPGVSMSKIREILQQTDSIIKQFPEVQTVFGKAGRADTATDPAPPSMLETTIVLNRDKTKWRTKPVERFFDNWPSSLSYFPKKIWPSIKTITIDDLIYGYDLPEGTHVPGLNDAIRFPGLTNAWTMPIKTRIDMLSTGIKTPVGIKVMGSDLAILAELAEDTATAVKSDPSLSSYTTSAFAEKSVGGNYFDIRINRDLIARYALSIRDVQDVIMSAIGGMNITFTVEGLERYPVNLRYPQEIRDNIDKLKQTLVATPSGAQIPLGQLAEISLSKGPPMIKSENARLTAWVYVDIAGLDVGTYVEMAQKVVASQIQLPQGYNIVWSGQYEYMQAARKRLMVVIPIAAVLILLLLYLATNSWLRVGIVLLAVPFSLVGAIWLLYFLDYNLSLAVWVGVIALAGLDAETGLVMLLYLETSFDTFKKEGRMNDHSDLWHAIHDGAVQRIRPKTMTVVTTFIGLFPLLWASGAGADTMRRLAAPMIGGLGTSFIMELLLYPVIYYLVKQHTVKKQSLL